MAGNRLGPRAKIVYESEVANRYYILSVDASFVVPKAGLGADEPELYDPENLPAGALSVTPAPKRFEPRGVWCKSADGKARKFVTCTSTTAQLYASTVPTEVAIDGETFTSTGRVGEKQSF